MLSKDEKPTFVLLGDSYANQLYPGLVKQSKLKSHNILSIGTCDPAKVDESQLTDHVNYHPCSGYRWLHQQQFIDNIIASNPTIQFAILEGLRNDPDSAYIEHLKARIDFLEAHNVKVIVFMPHIQFKPDIRGCFTRPFMTTPADCELNIDVRKKVSEAFEPVVDKLRETNPNVVFFDTNDLFCRSNKCSMVLDGMPLFRDEYHHISEFGSSELAARFLAWADQNLSELYRVRN